MHVPSSIKFGTTESRTLVLPAKLEAFSDFTLARNLAQ